VAFNQTTAFYHIKTKMEVILIRHTSVDVPQGVCYGQTDVNLKASFPEEAAAVKAQLQLYEPFEHVYCSPLSRCVKLATYCGYADAEREERILEINLGEWEMQEYEKISDPNIQRWYKDYFHVPATGGESFFEQFQRVSNFLNELKTKPFKRVAVFAHGGVLISAQIYAKVLPVENALEGLSPFGGIVKIEI